MRALLIFLAFIAAAAAQPSFDPYQFIDKKDLHNADVNQLWRTLGISGKIRETTANGSKDTAATFKCAADCEAQQVGLIWPLLDGGGEDVIVRITAPNSNFRRFLVFHREVAGWRLVDYLDSAEWDYDEPSVSTVVSGGNRWLVVKAWPHCGTGCSLIHTDWFELKNGRLRMVLTVPISGHQVNENPGRQFETRFVRASQSDGRETLELIYHVEFTPGFGSTVDADLWGDEKVIRFSRPTGQSEFKFDAKSSEASKGFVENIFSPDELGPSRLLGLVQDRLLAIANGPHDRRRGWLKDLLEQNPNLRELGAVREALGRAR
jgi:hypothetical protein